MDAQGREVTCNTDLQQLSEFHWLLMSQVNFPVVSTIHLKGNKFVTVAKIKATGESRLNDKLDAT